MKKLFHLLTVVVLLITAISFQSCSDEKYTVWTETDYYSDWVNAGGITIQEGNYVKIEIANANWPEISKSLTNEGKHRWDEATIKKWLIGNGFGDHEATREAAWLSLVDHGMILHHDNNMLHVIVK